ncbi:hypothetical protein [Actinomadura monticuli]|uniref:Uncharacterized protein n=1 Tax=Actinomadura monticuli TaxID=3097367 RepID=A0ABV4Q6P9_9ACTN
MARVLSSSGSRYLAEYSAEVPPVVLLTDPVLRDLITPERARTIATTPRGNNRH